MSIEHWGIVVGVATLIVALLGAVLAWWMPMLIRVRDIVRRSSPLFVLSFAWPYGPKGAGCRLKLENRGDGEALNVLLTLPGLPEPLVSIKKMGAGADHAQTILIPEDSPLFAVQRGEGSLTYRDIFGLRYRLPLTVGAGEHPHQPKVQVDRERMESPRLGPRDVWRLRHL